MESLQNSKGDSLSSQSDNIQSASGSCSDEDESKRQQSFEQQFRFQKKQKKYQQMTFLIGCLKNHFIFYNLSDTELQNVAKKMFYCSLPAQSYIFKEGTKSLCFFIIQKGMMQVIANGNLKKQIRVGDGFGQIALLYKSPRAFSVKATQNCYLWGIDRNTFRKAVQEIIILQYQQNKKFMENIRFFNYLTNEHKDIVASTVVSQSFTKGQIIVAEGDPGSSFYIIKEGVASIWKGNKFIAKLQKSDCFGEQALFYNTVRQMTVRADQDIICLILGRQNLVKALGDQIFIVTFRNFMRWSIQKSSHLSKLSKEQIDRILDLMKINHYKSGSVIIKKNSENNSGHKIIIVIQGALKKSKNPIPIASRSQIYGEQYMVQNKTKNRYEDDIVMESDGVLAQIKIEVVKQIIGGYLDVIIDNNQRKAALKLEEKIQKRNRFIDGLDDLAVLKQLKETQYGPVLLVGCLNPHQQNKLYVLRCYSLLKASENSMYKYINEQKNLFKQLYHPFIMELYKTFKDQNYIYSLVQFVQGEQLYSVIRQIGLLSTEDAQFYISSIILIIQYLFTQGVIIRDIKPQIFMVGNDGYLKIIDLVSAKQIKGKNIMTAKTSTLIGTPHYMAPQMISNKGYNWTISLYALGVNLFEFMCGYVPFGQKSEDPLDIYQQILNAQIRFPKSLKDKKAKKLMQQLLNKTQPDSRLGGPSFNSLKNNAWFQNLDWNDLLNKTLQPPKFQRNKNVKETQEQLTYMIDVSQNCVSYLDQKLPLRSVGQQQTVTNW